MPKEVYRHTIKQCKKNSTIGLLATEGTLKTGIYNKFFDKNFNLIFPESKIQKYSVNRAIKFVKMGDVKAASKIIKPAINYLINKKCKKIILGCTELPIAIFAFKAFDKINHSILLHKLRDLGITGQIGKWLGQFLLDRTQRVSLNGHLSSPSQVTNGVPQGTIP